MTIVAPISMFLNRFGSIMYFCCAAFFIGQVYGHNFTYEQIFFVITLSILGGLRHLEVVHQKALRPHFFYQF